MVKIEIVADLEKRRKKDWDYVDKVLKGDIEIDPERAKKTIIMTPEVFAKIFSPQRIRLILRLKKNKINNIYQLAKELNRKYEAVHRDIKYLKGMGIIKIKKKDRSVIPYIDESISIPALST